MKSNKYNGLFDINIVYLAKQNTSNARKKLFVLYLVGVRLRYMAYMIDRCTYTGPNICQTVFLYL